jgi:serpin B
MKKEASSQAMREVASANIAFGLKLFSRLNGKPGENVFLSPASIVWCLSMVLNGAEGKTRDEIASALEVSGINIRDLNAAYRDWKNSWGTLDPKIEIDVANSIWSRRGISIRPEFVELNKTFFDAQVSELNFNDPRSLSTINSWVNSKTRGKIERIIDQISADSVLFLINAIYFNGKWKHPFDAEKTKEDSFSAGSGKQKQVKMMRQRGNFLYTEQAQFQGIDLPYGNGRLSMLLFLPSSASGLQKFQTLLTQKNWQNWIQQFQETEGEIAMPRFKVDYEILLNDSLKSLGMKTAFSSQEANFQGMTTEPAYISSVKHKAFAEVTEEGTEAAAATSTEVRIVSMPVPTKTFRMIVNRPFFFAIRDNQSGVILFLGSITDPA